jgi:hypothetical protein
VSHWPQEPRRWSKAFIQALRELLGMRVKPRTPKTFKPY